MHKSLLRGRLKGNQIHFLSRLLDMYYTPAELAREISVSRRQFYRVYIPLGLPIIRQENGFVLIHGLSFRKWYEDTYRKIEIKPDEVYCLACKQVVKIQNAEEKVRDSYRYLLITCPNCGKKVSKAISNQRKKYDQSQ